MGPLRNPRHERYCQALFEGLPASAAYEEAGYVPNDGNAIRLKGNERVQARLAELQDAVAKKAEVTVESLLDELEHARQRADGLDQLSAAVKAISEKAKISGLLVQRVEVGGPGDFAGCDSTEAMADKILTDMIERFRPVDEKDRQGLVELIERHTQEMDEYISAIRARPITAERCDLTQLKPNWKELALHPSACVDNPAQRAYDEAKRQQHRRLTHGNSQR